MLDKKRLLAKLFFVTLSLSKGGRYPALKSWVLFGISRGAGLSAASPRSEGTLATVGFPLQSLTQMQQPFSASALYFSAASAVPVFLTQNNKVVENDLSKEPKCLN